MKSFSVAYFYRNKFTYGYNISDGEGTYPDSIARIHLSLTTFLHYMLSVYECIFIFSYPIYVRVRILVTKKMRQRHEIFINIKLVLIQPRLLRELNLENKNWLQLKYLAGLFRF